MKCINDEKCVRRQYNNDEKLRIRMNLHQKYSTAEQPYSEWIFSQFEFGENSKILELGSGNGDLWQNKTDSLPSGAHLTLSDFSDGMVRILNEKYGGRENIDCMQINAQNIPFADNSFDVIIANSMLYHVPDLDKAVSEIHRILKIGGTFYASTFGIHGIFEYICDTLRLRASDGLSKSFTLQNGEETLKKKFDNIQTLLRDDSLKVTNAADIADYVLSMTAFTDIAIPRDEIIERFSARAENGVINIPKEYGIFIAVK